MFVYYFALAPLPVAEAERRLLDRLDLLETWAGEAYRNGERIAAGVRVGSGVVSKQVQLRAWPVARTEGVATMRVAWAATGVPGLFPEMDGDLVLAALGDELTQVALRGSYRPPLGRVGTVLDRALLHRIAESSVKEFVDRIAREISPVSPPTVA